MNKFIYSIQLFSILMISILLPGCTAIGDIFKAGMWSGVIIVVLIIALILYLVRSRSNK